MPGLCSEDRGPRSLPSWNFQPNLGEETKHVIMTAELWRKESRTEDGGSVRWGSHLFFKWARVPCTSPPSSHSDSALQEASSDSLCPEPPDWAWRSQLCGPWTEGCELGAQGTMGAILGWGRELSTAPSSCLVPDTQDTAFLKRPLLRVCLDPPLRCPQSKLWVLVVGILLVASGRTRSKWA